MKKSLLIAAVGCMFVFSDVFGMCGMCSKKEHGKGKEHAAGHEAGYGEHCLAEVKESKLDVQNTDDGVVITITAEDEETIKEIQEKAEVFLEHFKECSKHGTEHKKEGSKKAIESKKRVSGKGTVICPVMGEKFKISKKTEFSVYKGKKYYFCCPGCKAKFDKNPEKYAK
jgi:YHS domain-containing protein